MTDKEYAVQCFKCLRVLGMCKEGLFDRKILCMSCAIKKKKTTNINKANYSGQEIKKGTPVKLAGCFGFDKATSNAQEESHE